MSEMPTKEYARNIEANDAAKRHHHTLDLFDYNEMRLPEDRWLRFAVRLTLVIGLMIVVLGLVSIVLLAVARLLLP